MRFSWSRRSEEDQRGITGLETAIVLIAFVMVASVFAYVVLSAGIFSSQKAKDAVQAGLSHTQNSLIVKGNMVGLLVNQSAARVLFTLAIAPGTESIPLHDSDGSVVVISYNDHLQYVPAVYWTATTLLSTGDDGILEQNGLFMLEVRLDESGIDPLPRAYTTFNLEIKSPTGVILDLRRTIPPTTASVVVLY